MEIVWRSYGDRMEIVWRSYGHRMEILEILFGDCRKVSEVPSVSYASNLVSGNVYIGVVGDMHREIDDIGGINLLFASISDAANSSRRSQQYKH